MADQGTEHRAFGIMDGENRRQRFGRLLAVYGNDWATILEEEVKRQFTRETQNNILLMTDTSQNIFRRIVREICTVYKKPAKRKIIRSSAGGEDVEVEVPRYGEIIQQARLDEILAEAHRRSKAGTVCFLKFGFTSEGIARVSIIQPDVVHLEFALDDPLRITLFAYLVQAVSPQGQRVEFWACWTDEWVFCTDGSGQEIANPFTGQRAEQNPYGVIPFVTFPATPPTISFWNEYWNRDAYDANLVIGVLATYMNYLVKTQSFKQIIFTGGGKADAADIVNAVLDPLFPIILPQGATAATLDLNTQIGAIDNVIRGKVSAIANNYGISNENFTLSGNVASGFSLRVANRALEEIREADLPVCAEVERQLFDMIRLVNNLDFAGDDIPEDVTLRWNPTEVAYPPTPEEEQADWTFKFENALASKVDYLIAHDPEMTREEAMEQLQQVKADNAALEPEKSPLDLMFGAKAV